VAAGLGGGLGAGIDERLVVVAAEQAGGGGVDDEGRAGAARVRVALGAVEIPPGESTLVLDSPLPPSRVPGDPRPLGVSVFRTQRERHGGAMHAGALGHVLEGDFLRHRLRSLFATGARTRASRNDPE